MRLSCGLACHPECRLTKLYAEGRFLGGFQADDGDCDYQDASRGYATWFQGREWISRAGKTVYELYYHGGLIRG